MPKVSIGLPCYNEEKYIEDTLRSWLSQTEADFELHLCDNCSTDKTVEVVTKVAAQDERVRLHVSDRNTGATDNFVRAYQNAFHSPYFMWASGHDVVHKDYVKKLLSVHEENPSCSLAYADSVFIGQDGTIPENEPIESGIPLPETEAAERYKKLLWTLHRCDLFYGLIRREAIDINTLFVKKSPDLVLLADLAIKGAFLRVPELLYFRRLNHGDLTNEENRRRLAEVGLLDTRLPDSHYSGLIKEAYLQLLCRSNIPEKERESLSLETHRAFEKRFGVPWVKPDATPEQILVSAQEYSALLAGLDSLRREKRQLLKSNKVLRKSLVRHVKMLNTVQNSIKVAVEKIHKSTRWKLGGLLMYPFNSKRRRSGGWMARLSDLAKEMKPHVDDVKQILAETKVMVSAGDTGNPSSVEKSGGAATAPKPHGEPRQLPL